jgi:dTDP-4-dehydrorhamnose 3,5-epimerase
MVATLTPAPSAPVPSAEAAQPAKERQPLPVAVRIESPRVWPVLGDVRAAWEHATTAREPVFVPVAVHADDRGWSLMNQMLGVMSAEGQVNYSLQYPGVVKAWHRHAKQTDFWICLNGHLKAGIHRPDDGRTWMQVFGEKRPGVLIIPPTLWHGAATVGHEPAGLLYYVTHAYDPAKPDEERRPFDSVEGFPWEVRHR